MCFIRLIQNRLKTLPLTRPAAVKSAYIGTETRWEPAGTIRAEVQPLSDNATAEQYGVKFSRSVQLICDTGTDIRERDRVKLPGGTYEVRGVTTYGNVRKAVCELV